MSGKLYTLELRDPDGKPVWARHIEPEQVDAVARFLHQNLGLIMAAKGFHDAARGVGAMIAALDGMKPRKRVSARRRR